MLRLNHIERYKAAPSSENANQKGIGCRNQKDLGRRARESGRQHCGSRGTTQESPQNRSRPEKGLGGRVRLRKSRHRHARFSLRSPLPAEDDLPLSAGFQTMAITRKRSLSSAVKDDSSASQDEDGGPLKKTASKHFNIKSTESLPLPRSGPLPVITKIVHLEEKEEVLRILLDTGSMVPLLSRKFTEDKQIPVAE